MRGGFESSRNQHRVIEIRNKLSTDRPRPVEVNGRLQLPFEQRQKSRVRALLVSGEEVAVLLPRGDVMRGGDLLAASDGRVIEVVAEPEKLMHVECDSPAALMRCAYHLGNRHASVEIGRDCLRLGADHVLKDMLIGLGARVTLVDAPFEPEAGAYGAVHSHAGEVRVSRIHDFSDRPASNADNSHGAPA